MLPMNFHVWRHRVTSHGDARRFDIQWYMLESSSPPPPYAPLIFICSTTFHCRPRSSPFAAEQNEIINAKDNFRLELHDFTFHSDFAAFVLHEFQTQRDTESTLQMELYEKELLKYNSSAFRRYRTMYASDYMSFGMCCASNTLQRDTQSHMLQHTTACYPIFSLLLSLRPPTVAHRGWQREKKQQVCRVRQTTQSMREILKWDFQPLQLRLSSSGDASITVTATSTSDAPAVDVECSKWQQCFGGEIKCCIKSNG